MKVEDFKDYALRISEEASRREEIFLIRVRIAIVAAALVVTAIVITTLVVTLGEAL